MKVLKIITNIFYATGCIIVLVLGAISVFGSGEPVFPEAMIPYSWRETAFIWLAVGSVPMLAACFAVFFLNRTYFKPKKLIYKLTVFIPGMVCLCCAVFILAFIAYWYIGFFIVNVLR